MTTSSLIAMLERIRDGLATGEELSRARELVVADDRLPQELREAGLLEDDAVDDAVALLALFDAEPLFGAALGEALAAEAGPFEADAWEAEVEDPAWVAVADALRDGLRAEAHRVDVSGAVLRAIGARAVPVADAVRSEGGTTDVVGTVTQALALDHAPVVVAAPVGDAVRGEAGRIDLADAVMAAIGASSSVPVAAAVRHEAGPIDVAAVVAEVAQPAWLSALLDHELSPEAHRLAARALLRDSSLGASATELASLASAVRQAVAEEAGPAPAVWTEVAHAIGLSDPEAVEGWDPTLVRDAVAAEAGTVDVRAAVMSRVLSGSVRQRSVGDSPALPEPANTASGWRTGLVALAAALLVAVIGGRSWLTDASPTQPDYELQFASASEIVVNELVPGENAAVMVIHEDDENAPMIIWVDDEEAML